MVPSLLAVESFRAVGLYKTVDYSTVNGICDEPLPWPAANGVLGNAEAAVLCGMRTFVATPSSATIFIVEQAVEGALVACQERRRELADVAEMLKAVKLDDCKINGWS